MADFNYYEILRVSPTATQDEIKQAYRRLVKVFHPDSNRETADREKTVRINAAYEVLGDRQKRQGYDRKRRQGGGGKSEERREGYRSSEAHYKRQHQQAKQAAHNADNDLSQWLKLVYRPVNRILFQILNSLDREVDQLSADPFDDDLMAEFQTYLNICRRSLDQAQQFFRSMPNPSNVAGVAANLYYSLDRVADGIEELEFFTLNYDDRCLHAGQELFRIAAGLHAGAQEAIGDIGQTL
ncbi:MAG: J domain-containing protein [Oscillatoria sp. SIO1A7]|nr:J domain-containing protein [Oscillatoria sp. SIO1A7]